MGFSNLITKAVGEVASTILSNNTQPSVVELGNQTLKNKKARAEIYKKLNIEPAKELISTKDWYLSIGFEKYLAIDVNTERDAIAMDLNTDISKQYNFHEQFDLVTDNGTGEHVFNQYTLFKNARMRGFREISKWSKSRSDAIKIIIGFLRSLLLALYIRSTVFLERADPTRP